MFPEPRELIRHFDVTKEVWCAYVQMIQTQQRAAKIKKINKAAFFNKSILHWIKENAGQLHAADLTPISSPFQGDSLARRQGLSVMSVMSFSGAEAKTLLRQRINAHTMQCAPLVEKSSSRGFWKIQDWSLSCSLLTILFAGRTHFRHKCVVRRRSFPRIFLFSSAFSSLKHQQN